MHILQNFWQIYALFFCSSLYMLFYTFSSIPSFSQFHIYRYMQFCISFVLLFCKVSISQNRFYIFDQNLFYILPYIVFCKLVYLSIDISERWWSYNLGLKLFLVSLLKNCRNLPWIIHAHFYIAVQETPLCNRIVLKVWPKNKWQSNDQQ